MILFFLILIHVLIWGFILFGGLFGKKYAIWNMKYIIPFVYLIHILPFHLIVKEKIQYIDSHFQELWDPKYETIKYTQEDINQTDKYIVKHDKVKIYQILKANEQSFFIVKIFEQIKSLFNNSFQNPLSPQGLLILGYILNFEVYT